ncbi:MAG: hypothetical protein JO142_18400 [Burkholderiales bacterium]|nr:hypothetical protein [Burkholderiales bacterium]
MQTRSLAAASSALILGAVSLPTHAGVFDVTATVNNTTQSETYNTVDAALAAATDQGLHNLAGSYTGVEAANLDIDFRGVAVLLAFPTANSTLLTLNIPSINVSQQFQGTTRDDSQSALRDYIKKNADLLSRLQKQLVKSSPVDPVAGNPNSMMSRSAAADFTQGLVSPSQVAGQSDTGQSSNVFGFMPSYTKMVNHSLTNPRDMDSDTVSLPLSYTHKFATPGKEFDIYVPLAESTVDGAKAYDVGISVAYRTPVTPRWYLAFSGGVRATGSQDLGSGVAMANGTITSSYIIPGDHWSYTIGNMIGQYSAMKVKINDTAYDPGIHNTIFRNGVLIEQNSGWQVLGEAATVEYTIIDTRFTGTDLFNKHQDEFGITIGSKRANNAHASDFRGGLAYTKAPNSKGWAFNFGYWF